jgi:hypothetical protein
MEQLMKGMTAETLPSGIRFVRLHYSADPAKDQVWAEQERKKEADPRNWDTQMEMRRIVTDGYPVFPRFNEKQHVPVEGYDRHFRLDDSPCLYLGGWDAGQTLNPAFVLLEWRTNPVRVRALLEVVSIGGEDMDQFAPRVKETVDHIYPGLLPKVTHYADPTITTRSGSTGQTAQQIAKRYGFELIASTNDWTSRSTAVSHILAQEELFELCRHGCPTLYRGFLGQYRYMVSKSGDQVGAGVKLMSPVKNAYSHIQDGLQYPAMTIFDALVPRSSAPMRRSTSRGYV